MEQAKAHGRVRVVEYRFPVLKQQSGFQETRLPGLSGNHRQMTVPAPLDQLIPGAAPSPRGAIPRATYSVLILKTLL